MKSFNQFQQNCSYLNEGAAEKFAAMDDKQFADYVSKNPGGAEKAKNLRDQGLKGKTTKVPGSVLRGQPASAAASGGRPPKGPTGGGGGGGNLPPNPPPGGGGGGKIIKAGVGGAAQGVASGGLKSASTKIPGLKSGGAISAALGTADEKMKGSGWLRSLAKGATVGAGAVLGGIAGGTAGTAIAPGAGTAIGGYAGQAAGAAAADKAFDVAAGANAKERAAMAKSNRQRQAGGGLAGIGGKTTFSKGKGGTAFMSTGVGKQRKTVQLDKTSVVRDAKGKEAVGHLAFKGGKAVYKRAADPSTLARTSSNPFERIGRSLFAGAYKKSDAAQQQKKIAAARQSDVKRQQKLGVKMKPGG